MLEWTTFEKLEDPDGIPRLYLLGSLLIFWGPRSPGTPLVSNPACTSIYTLNGLEESAAKSVEQTANGKGVYHLHSALLKIVLSSSLGGRFTRFA